MKVIKDEDFRVPLKVWSESIEDGALQQAANCCKLPMAFRHVALMPDGHLGFGVPIGSVVVLNGCVSPAMVGVDIGCGMLAVKTSLTDITTERLKEIMTLIRKRIPVGFEHHSECQDDRLMPFSLREFNDLDKGLYPVVSQEYLSSLKQLGTLGGGNHFIEIQKDQEGCIWFMIHSGSRNIGLKVAKYYNDLATELNAMWYSSVPAKHELAFLPIKTKEAQDYLREMTFCLKFAEANRNLMADQIRRCFEEVPCGGCNGQGGRKGEKCSLCGGSGLADHFHKVEFFGQINIHHNYASIENHFGHNVWVHRKGATSAREGEMGIIPGSQGTASYIVRGKGNPESFMSCSHGAGRRMGRREAQRSLSLEGEKRFLDEQGIIHGIRGTKDLDEAPGAYKNVDEVLEQQADLVDVVAKLKPLAVIKG